MSMPPGLRVASIEERAKRLSGATAERQASLKACRRQALGGRIDRGGAARRLLCWNTHALPRALSVEPVSEARPEYIAYRFPAQEDAATRRDLRRRAQGHRRTHRRCHGRRGETGDHPRG